MNSVQDGGPVLNGTLEGGGRGNPLDGRYMVSRNSSEYVFLENVSHVLASNVGYPDVFSENSVLAKRLWSELKDCWCLYIAYVCCICSSCLRIRCNERIMLR